MNKKTKIYFFVLIWVAVIVQFFVNGAVNREKQMVEEAISNSAYSLSKGSVSLYGYYSNERLTTEDKEQMLKSLAKIIGITSDYTITHNYDGENETTILCKEGEYADTSIKIISLVGTDNNQEIKYENYFLTDLTLWGDSAKKTYTYKKYLYNMYQKFGISPITNIYVCNQYEGKLSENEIDEEISTFLDLMDADEIETIKLDNVICVYGYSRNIGNYVYQNNKKVNVNIAIAYDEEQDITYIHKAIPFVDKSF